MSHFRPEKIRDAQNLARHASELRDAEPLIVAGHDLRVIGRPDISLQALERCRPTSGFDSKWALEYCLTMAALGRTREALQTVHELRRRDPMISPGLKLIAIIDDACGTAAIDKANIHLVLPETIATDDPADILSTMPLREVWKVPLRRLLGADIGLSREARVRLVRRANALKIAFGAVNLIAALLLAGVRLRYGRRDVHIASLGDFTRLADIVDRADPVLRRLRDSAGNGRPPLLVALYFDGYPNKTLIRLYQRHCRLVYPRNRLTRALSRRAFSLLQRAGRDLPLTTDYRRIKDDFLAGLPIIHFPDTEARAAEQQLRRLGIEPEKPIVCFGLRDMAYYKFYGTVAGVGASAGSRSDTAHRCPPIEPYAVAARFWADHGYQMVRMGLRVTDPLPGDDHPLVFDYARNGRSDELDAYLFSRCKFLLAGDTGLFSGAAAFDRPAVVSDLFLVRNTIYSSNKTTPNIFVPKLVFDLEEGRYLSFAEWIFFNQLFSFSEDCRRARFELVHNSPEDLIDATNELVERLDGRYEEAEEDAELQRRFHNIYVPCQVGYGSTGRVSAKFLRKYANLLD
jgi:putative glycosyltransferase (TIGR04372 family)